jgi:hypothetical protein
MTALGTLGPRPETVEGWGILRGVLRVVVLSCLLPGALVALMCGGLLYLQHPSVFRRLRWFRLKVTIVIVATPALHLWARGRALAFDEALAAGRVGELNARWNAITVAFGVALIIYAGVAVIGRLKPRLGEPHGSRRSDRATERRSD